MVEKCVPLRLEYRNFPSRRVLVNLARTMAGIRRARYSYYRDREGRVYIYIIDRDNPRRRVKLVVRPVEHVHEDSLLIDHYWSVVYAYLCEKVDDENAG